MKWRELNMKKIDYILMDLSLQMKIHFLKFLYFFMFRDCKQCRSFCLTCKQFDECTEATIEPATDEEIRNTIKVMNAISWNSYSTRKHL